MREPYGRRGHTEGQADAEVTEMMPVPGVFDAGG
jgi:hypothetical protein